jgi:hypothetical protein
VNSVSSCLCLLRNYVIRVCSNCRVDLTRWSPSFHRTECQIRGRRSKWNCNQIVMVKADEIVIDIDNSIWYNIEKNSESTASAYRCSSSWFGSAQLCLKRMCLKVLKYSNVGPSVAYSQERSLLGWWEERCLRVQNKTFASLLGSHTAYTFNIYSSTSDFR